MELIRKEDLIKVANLEYLGGENTAKIIMSAFNNSLDGLMKLDLADIPKDIIHSLSKETEDYSIFDKFTSQLN